MVHFYKIYMIVKKTNPQKSRDVSIIFIIEFLF